MGATTGTTHCPAGIETVTDEHAAHAVASGGALLVGFFEASPAGPGSGCGSSACVAGLEREMVTLAAELDPPVRAVAVDVRSGRALARAAGVDRYPALVVFSAVCPVFHHVGDDISPDLVAEVSAALAQVRGPVPHLT